MQCSCFLFFRLGSGGPKLSIEHWNMIRVPREFHVLELSGDRVRLFSGHAGDEFYLQIMENQHLGGVVTERLLRPNKQVLSGAKVWLVPSGNFNCLNGLSELFTGPFLHYMISYLHYMISYLLCLLNLIYII